MIPVVWSAAHERHDPQTEIWVGVATPAVEVAARAEAIRATLTAAGHPLVLARPQPDAAVRAVHDDALLEFLATAWAAWEESGLREDPGQDRVLPYIFPHPGLLGTLAPATPKATWARTGMFCFDTMTPIGPGTWDAARGAADAALTAAELVLAGEARAAYAATRPPGHHATRSAYGGSCYLNSAAIAAARLAAAGSVALLDLDAHHGNGAQSIFYERTDVLTGSVHVDPAAGWFPHFFGGAGETGAGANRNLPLAPGSGDGPWLDAVRELVRWATAARPRALVVALGVDAAAGDPESPLQVSADGFRAAGRMLGGLRLPTVIVQEGGYDVDALGGLVAAALAGIEEGTHG